MVGGVGVVEVVWVVAEDALNEEEVVKVDGAAESSWYVDPVEVGNMSQLWGI